MAYTPYGYQNSYYPQAMPDNLMQMRQQQMMQQPMSALAANQPAMIWVQGEVGARSYLVSAGNTVPLWDSENQVIYLKSVDASGVPSMRILDYTERTVAHKAAPTVVQQGEYVTRKEFEELAALVSKISGDTSKEEKANE